MPIPHARLDHVSFTVTNLRRLADFYQLLGYRPQPPYVATGPDVEAGTGVVGAQLEIQELHRNDGGPMLELIEYTRGGQRGDGHPSRVGAAHLCFEVCDLEAALAELQRAGGRPLSTPHVDSRGAAWVYVLDPDGNAVELTAAPTRR